MTVGEQFDANPRGGAIPIRGVLTGQGERYSNVDLYQACSDLYREDTKAKFEEALALDCAPAARMCESIYSIPDNAITFNIPLGDEWFTLDGSSADTDLTGSFKIFVDTIVSLVDKKSGIKAYAQVLAEVPLVQGGVARWCEQESAKVDLVEVAGAHLLVGTVGLDSEFDRLRKWYNVQSSTINPQGPTNIDSDSIEEGLMTLILYGDEKYFGSNRSRSSTFTLELEDVITVHIMEEFDTVYQKVMGLMTRDDAFEITFDRWGLHAHLDPTTNLSAICPFFPRQPRITDPFPATCVTRRDRKRRVNMQTNNERTVMELTAGLQTKQDAGEYMQTILGGSDYARDIGQNFSQIIRARFNINDRFNRAFWINPGYEWMPQIFGTRFTISQRLIMFCLINLDEGLDTAVGGPIGRREGSRRMILTSERERRATTTEKANNEVSSFNMKYSMDQLKMLTEFLGVDESLVTMWSITTQLTDEQICMSTDKLKEDLRAVLLGYMNDVSEDVEDLHVAELTIEGAEDVDCTGSRRLQNRRKFNQDASCVTRTVVVFKEEPTDGKLPFIDVNELRQQPGILVAKPERLTVCPEIMEKDETPSTLCIRLDAHTTQSVIDDQNKNRWENWGEEEKKGSDNSLVGIICGVVGGLVAVGLCAAVLIWKKKQSDQQVLEVESVYQASKDIDPKEALRGELRGDVCLDGFGGLDEPTFREKVKNPANAVVDVRSSESNSSEGGNQLNWDDAERRSNERLSTSNDPMLALRGETRSSEALLQDKDFGAC
jgi:hypothetical protein